MKKVILLFLLVLFTSCNKDDDYPTLKIVNQTTNDLHFVKSVKLVGYDFENLIIESNDSQVFKLNNGMPSGYEDINVRIWINHHYNLNKNIQVNFDNGETTTITITGCCSDIEIN